jgi:hypothetical protein
MTLDEFFAGHADARRIFEAVAAAVSAMGPAEVRVVSKSQIAFRRRTGLAFFWMPGMYLRKGDVPLVLTVEPAPGRFTHHLELHCPSEVDAAVCGWLREAWQGAE